MATGDSVAADALQFQTEDPADCFCRFWDWLDSRSAASSAPRDALN
jgi:hypothetical protein